MKANSFKELLFWQKAFNLTDLVYTYFKSCRDYSFVDQIRLASISIMNNIAEGFERQGDKDIQKFMYIAKSSSGEVRSMLYIAYKHKYIDADQFEELKSLSLEVSKLIFGFIKGMSKTKRYPY